MLVCCHVTESFGKIASAVTLGWLIQELKDGSSTTFNMKLIYIYVSVYFACTILKVVGSHHIFFRGAVVGCKTRTALTAFLYRRILKMKISSKISSGKALNFISGDLIKFEHVFPLLHYSYIALFECLAIFFFLYVHLKAWSMFFGIVFVFFLLSIQLIISYLMGVYQEKLAGLRDELTKCISDAISGILAIKCFNWEGYFEKIALTKRAKMYSFLRILNILEGINASLFYITSNIVSFAAFYFFSRLDKMPLTISAVTVVFSLFGETAISISCFLPSAITGILQLNVSLKRFIQICDEIDIGEMHQIEYSLSAGSESCAVFENVSINWSRSEHVALSEDEGLSSAPTTINNNILTNLNLSIQKGELVGLVGPIGSGKSTILLSLLDELNISSGTIKMSSANQISYAPQAPWMLPGTIRENILLGRKYVPELYDEVISMCCLEKDFASFPERDMKLVGEKGASLSGGQRARICLARTFYTSDATIFLLDDVMSAVDSKVGNILFRNISNYLQRISTADSLKTCILVTHQLQYLKYFDKIIVLNKDGLDFFGSYYQLLRSNCEILDALEEYSDMSTEFYDETEGTIHDRPEEMSLKFRPHSDKSEESLAPVLKPIPTPRVSQLIENDADTCNNLEFTTVEETMCSGSVPLSIYKRFFAGEKILPLRYILIFVFSVGAQVFLLLLETWTFEWPEQSITEQNKSKYPLLILSGCILCTVFLLLRAFTFLSHMAYLANFWFKKMIQSVYNAPMKFFIDNPHGRVMNRFISDQTILDEYIGSDFFDTVQCSIYAIFIISFVAFNCWWIIIAFLPAIIIVEFLRRKYINASRKTKRIESVLRSPVFSLLSSTLQGLPVIRSLKLEVIFDELFVRYLDTYTSATFYSYGTNRWFGILVDFTLTFLNLIIFVLIIFSASKKRISIDALSQSLTYSGQLIGLVQWILRQSCEAENLMTSTERALEYCSLELDDPQYFNKATCCDSIVPVEWPNQGSVVMNEMHLSYPSRKDPVLKGITLNINDGEKIALVGRTGAGKSSLLFALFRIFEPYPSGSIQIDSISTSSISKHRLREALSIIPQEAIIFRNTLRFNLDPSGKSTDEAIWNALNRVQIKESIEYFPEGLDLVIDPGENVFSAGEKQLLCLARAILANRRIVVMDEATANVDLMTTHKMQEAMRSAFSSCTVCTIAHRLHTIIEYDKVVVLESGNIKEVGHPHVLLEAKTSAFSSMVRELGPDTEQILRDQARDSYASKMHSKSQ